MTNSDAPGREAETPRERMSKLNAAILRINASLRVETVLREVVDGARVLTGARHGVITTVDEAGLPRDYVTSGFTPEEEQQLAGWQPGGLRLFEHLSDREAPLRLDDFPGFIRSLGLSAERIPSTTFQGTPMRYRGVHVGNFFLGDKEGEGSFTDEDEELLVLFASQAAIAIANARAHRDEQRARANLEALVETSPVGVVVFDAQSGNPLSLNREAKRIVDGLLGPDRPLENLREVLTSRFAGGRELTFDEMKNAQTLRAAEVELSAPDGRSLRMLVNATPICSGEGDVDSVVVTMQDLAPLQELERLRVEFLGMVSHELRAPLTSIKGSTTTLLGTSRVLDRTEQRQFIRIIDEQADHMQGLVSDLLDAGRIDSGTLSVDPEPLEVAALVEQARTTFLSAGGRQPIRIDLPPDLPRVMADKPRIVQVLNNLLSNAARHSPESSPIEVSAVRDGIEVAVSVTDEGRGVAPERLPHLFRRYADAGDGERGAAGFGLGLVICRGLVEAHGGRIRAESAGPGLGTRVTFTLQVDGQPVRAAAPGLFPGGAHPPGREPEPVPVLVVDDDPETSRFVRDALAAAGYAPLVTGEPEEAASLVRTRKPNLVLLDLVLPGTDGIELMQSVPGMTDVPVILISGHGRDETVVRALDAGAADYIVKPFTASELTARVRAALRRQGTEPFVLGALTIDYAHRQVTVDGQAVKLTLTEYELLRVLSLNAGRVVAYDSLLRQVWGERHSTDAQLVRNFVKKLRHKLGNDAASPAWIRNERGVGYRMSRPGELQGAPTPKPMAQSSPGSPRFA